MYDGDVDDMFYSESPLVMFPKVKNHFCGRLAILKGDSLALQCQKLHPNVLKIPLFNWYIKNFCKGMLTVCGWKNELP